MNTYVAWEIVKEKSELSLLLISYRLLTTTVAMRNSCRLAASTGFLGEGVCMEEGRATGAAFLRILGHDPGPIETMLPKLAVQGVHSMRFAAVSAEERVKTGCTIRCGKNRGVCIRSTLATEDKGSVIIFTVRAGTERAVHVRRVAEVRVMTPRTTAGAVGHTHVKGCLLEEANR